MMNSWIVSIPRGLFRICINLPWFHPDYLSYRVANKFDKILRRITDQAMQVTQKVTLLQNEERKKLIDHIKKAMTAEIQLKKHWHEIVQNLTHERYT